jgi:hypothetical protein
MNRGEIRTTARMLLGEGVADGYVDTNLNTMINNSCLHVATKTLCLFTYKDIPSVASQEQYGLPNDLLSLKDVQLFVSGYKYQLRRLSYDEYEDYAHGTATEGRPEVFRSEFGRTDLAGGKAGDIWLRPIPDVATYTIRRVYYQKPSVMSNDGDITELPESMHLVVAYHAAMVISRKFSDTRRFADLATLYQDELANAMNLVHRQDRVGPRFEKNIYRVRRRAT